MKRALSILILSSYFFGVSQATASNALGAATVIKVTHAHAQSDHHHGNEDSDESEHHHEEDSHQSASHSHEFVIPSVGFYTSNEVSNFVCFELIDEGFPMAVQLLPPRDPSLDSIFRPPIV